jgi:hypothetical protein
VPVCVEVLYPASPPLSLLLCTSRLSAPACFAKPSRWLVVLQSAHTSAVAREDEMEELKAHIGRLEAEARERQEVLNSLRRDGWVGHTFRTAHMRSASHPLLAASTHIHTASSPSTC